MKNNPVQDKSPVHGDDFVILPEPRTAINICSKDTMNITVSRCSLNVFHNLAKVQHICNKLIRAGKNLDYTNQTTII